MHSLHIDYIKACAEAVNYQFYENDPDLLLQGASDVPRAVEAYWYALCMFDMHPFPTDNDILHMQRIASPVNIDFIVELWRKHKLLSPLELSAQPVGKDVS